MWFMLRCRRDWTGRRTSPPTFAIRTIATLVIKMLLLFSHQHYIIFKTFINTRFPGNMVGPQVAFLLLIAAFARNFWRSRPLWVRCPSLCVRYRPINSNYNVMNTDHQGTAFIIYTPHSRDEGSMYLCEAKITSLMRLSPRSNEINWTPPWLYTDRSWETPEMHLTQNQRITWLVDDM